MLKPALLALANAMPNSSLGFQLRVRLLRMAGMKLGKSMVIMAPLTVLPQLAAGTISIGRKSYLGARCRFGGRAGVSIGEFAQIAPDVSFDTATHTLDFEAGKARPTIQHPITVEDHVWIGTGARILGGVTIGRGAVVAAGAIVTKNVAPLTVVGGVPAKPISTVKEAAPGTLAG